MDGYIHLLEDLLDVTKEETKERFADATIKRTDESINDWDSMHKLERVVRKELLKMLQNVRD